MFANVLARRILNPGSGSSVVCPVPNAATTTILIEYLSFLGPQVGSAGPFYISTINTIPVNGTSGFAINVRTGQTLLAGAFYPYEYQMIYPLYITIPAASPSLTLFFWNRTTGALGIAAQTTIIYSEYASNQFVKLEQIMNTNVPVNLSQVGANTIVSSNVPVDIKATGGTTLTGTIVPTSATFAGTTDVNVKSINGTLLTTAFIPINISQYNGATVGSGNPIFNSQTNIPATQAINITQTGGTTLTGGIVPTSLTGTLDTNIKAVNGTNLTSNFLPT